LEIGLFYFEPASTALRRANFRLLALSFYFEVGTRQKIRRALTQLGTGIGNWKLEIGFSPLSLGFYFLLFTFSFEPAFTALGRVNFRLLALSFLL
jgi:hypothetical protein